MAAKGHIYMPGKHEITMTAVDRDGRVDTERVSVLCCCNPSNEIGTVPAGVNPKLKLREWEDEDGRVGVAHPSGSHGGDNAGVDWPSVEGFVAGKGKGGRKTWKKKTWRKKGDKR